MTGFCDLPCQVYIFNFLQTDKHSQSNAGHNNPEGIINVKTLKSSHCQELLTITKGFR